MSGFKYFYEVLDPLVVSCMLYAQPTRIFFLDALST